MEHFTEKISFEGEEIAHIKCQSVEQMDRLFNHRLIPLFFDARGVDRSKLVKFVRHHYAMSPKGENVEKAWWKVYAKMIKIAIRRDNLEALEILWQGIYWHDRDAPDFETDLVTAATWGNIKTFQHVLYGRCNYSTLNGCEPINVKKLKEVSVKNPDTHAYICALFEGLDENVEGFSEDCLEDFENDRDNCRTEGDFEEAADFQKSIDYVKLMVGRIKTLAC